MDGAGIISSEPAKEEEMSKLVFGFSAQVRKRATCSEGEFTLVSNGKHPKRSSPNEEDQKDWAIILVDSPDQAFDDQPVLEGAPSEACAPMEEGIPVRGPSNVDETREESPSGVAATPIPLPRHADTVFSRRRSP